MSNSENNKIHLSFTIGPVQSFVAQSRRMRDLWAGSWLLSYLAECALVAAEEKGGIAIIPFRETPKEITSKQTVVGGMPNRFELIFESKEAAKIAAISANHAMQEAWYNVATVVFEKYVKPAIGKGNNTKEIWDRQIENFWETSWVIGKPKDDAQIIAHLAAARKNIRDTTAKKEAGTKCSLMGSLQEISGHYGHQQKDFWIKLCAKISGFDIKENERLCAIALIKRLYPHKIKKSISNDICPALEQQESWPSTAFMAALPWLKTVASKADSEAIEYEESAKQAGWSSNERQAAKEVELHSDWAHLDGPAWFIAGVRQNEVNADQDKLQEQLRKLNSLYKEVKSKPVPYYALLLMDGDSMGKLVATLGSPEKVSKGLHDFSQRVDGIVSGSSNLGRTIYAGGDDVMAILPAESALAAANELSKAYAESFKGIPQATLSGAIIYAHWKFPLKQVLQTAHHLLDDIAKERTGRDSLTIGVIQSSGLGTMWSAPWKVVREQLMNNINKFGSNSSDDEMIKFNTSFLYLLREQYTKLFAKPIELPGSFGLIALDGDLLTDLANSEYRRRLGKQKCNEQSPADTKELVQPLLELSQQWKRRKESAKDDGKYKCISDPKTFSFDGWRVGQFLNQINDRNIDGHE